MKELQFDLYFCGMGEKTFSEQIMIYKPHSSITKNFTDLSLRWYKIASVGELIGCLKKDIGIRESLGSWGLENFSTETVYIRYQAYLLGLQKDKLLSEIFRDFKADKLEFAHFIVGGASLHNETSYRFTIHPDEKVHEHMPHVHVSKAGVEIRYSLDTLLPIDPLVPPHKRDNKRIITPFLQQNREKLLTLWNYYQKGYTIPQITQEGQQFYRES